MLPPAVFSRAIGSHMGTWSCPESSGCSITGCRLHRLRETDSLPKSLQHSGDISDHSWPRILKREVRWLSGWFWGWFWGWCFWVGETSTLQGIYQNPFQDGHAMDPSHPACHDLALALNMSTCHENLWKIPKASDINHVCFPGFPIEKSLKSHQLLCPQMAKNECQRRWHESRHVASGARVFIIAPCCIIGFMFYFFCIACNHLLISGKAAKHLAQGQMCPEEWFFFTI